MDYQAVFFDFDYTLGDATESIMAGFRYAFETMGLPVPEEKAVRATVGYLLQDGYAILSGDRELVRAEEFLGLFKSRCNAMQLATVKLLPGARELLEALHAAGVRLGVVSSKGSHALMPVLKKLEIDALMDFAIAGDMVKRPKPDPEGLNLGIARFGLEKERVLYCGDTVLDAQTAAAAGTHFCAVLGGVTPAEDFAAYPCDHIAPDLPDLQRWLGL